MLATQCLNRRLEDLGKTKAEVDTWEDQRNADGVTITWLFTTARARRKLSHAYPIPA